MPFLDKTMPAPFNQIQPAVAVGASLTDVFTFPFGGIERDLTILIANTGNVNATNNLAILRQFTDGGAWIPWLSGTDFSTATRRYSPSTNPAPNAIAVGQIAFVDFDPGACVAIKAQASSTSGTTVQVTLCGRVDR
jgi:hypothetical protein